MQSFKIEPHVGIGPVKLGAARADVHRALGEPMYRIEGGREVFGQAIIVDFDVHDSVEFIELLRSDEFCGVYLGQDLHGLAWGDAVEHVSQSGDSDRRDPEYPAVRKFVGLQMALRSEKQPGKGDGALRVDSVSIAVEGYFADSPNGELTRRSRVYGGGMMAAGAYLLWLGVGAEPLGYRAYLFVLAAYLVVAGIALWRESHFSAGLFLVGIVGLLVLPVLEIVVLGASRRLIFCLCTGLVGIPGYAVLRRSWAHQAVISEQGGDRNANE